MMNKATILVSIIFFISCEINTSGPQGPEGPPGPVGQGFEVQASFSESNGYQQIFKFPANLEVLATDIVVAYLLWDVDSETGNDIWQQLPVSVFFNDGELQYAFDHTVADVKLFLTGDTNLNTVGDGFTQNQIFRVAILPVDYVQSNKVNLQNIEQVMQGIEKNRFKRMD